MHRKALFTTLFVLAVTLIAGIWPRGPEGVGRIPAVVEPPRKIEAFQLQGHWGGDLGPTWLTGHWTILFFGYTHCPDVCPTTMALIGGALDLVTPSEDQAPVRGLFVSVDPQRDTLPLLADYVSFFHPAMYGATGRKEQIDNLTKQVRAPYLLVPLREREEKGEGYTVAHASGIFFIDPQGIWREVLSQAGTSADIVAVLDRLRSRVTVQTPGQNLGGSAPKPPPPTSVRQMIPPGPPQ